MSQFDGETTATGSLLAENEGNGKNRIWSVAFSPDDITFVGGGGDGVITFWSVREIRKSLCDQDFWDI